MLPLECPRMTPSESAEIEAKKTFELFIQWTKRIVLISFLFLMVVVVACNNGVETGKNATGSKYNGEQYNPSNLKVKK